MRSFFKLSLVVHWISFSIQKENNEFSSLKTSFSEIESETVTIGELKPRSEVLNRIGLDETDSI